MSINKIINKIIEYSNNKKDKSREKYIFIDNISKIVFREEYIPSFCKYMYVYKIHDKGDKIKRGFWQRLFGHNSDYEKFYTEDVYGEYFSDNVYTKSELINHIMETQPGSSEYMTVKK